MVDQLPWRILVVDDDTDTCRQVKEFLEAETVGESNDRLEVETITSFDSALEHLEKQRVDIVILDVRVGPLDEGSGPEEEAGITVLQAIQQRRFVPIVFYTGLPHFVRSLETSVICVLEKTADIQNLLEAVKQVLHTQLPNINRALIRHLETVQREYMWQFAAEHWEQFVAASDRTDLAYLLARRLAMSLSGSGISQLATDLGAPIENARDALGDKAHPMRYYILPPVERLMLLAGDIFQGSILGNSGYWILLTPTCDMVQKKVEYLVFAACELLTDSPEYEKWIKTPSNSSKRILVELLRNSRGGQRERFVFLPGAMTLPDLIVDFQRVVAVSASEIDESLTRPDGTLERLASLDSPFVESFMSKFVRYFGRLGTPDLDTDSVISRLTSN